MHYVTLLYHSHLVESKRCVWTERCCRMARTSFFISKVQGSNTGLEYLLSLTELFRGFPRSSCYVPRQHVELGYGHIYPRLSSSSFSNHGGIRHHIKWVVQIDVKQAINKQLLGLVRRFGVIQVLYSSDFQHLAAPGTVTSTFLVPRKAPTLLQIIYCD
jgi:hypothetical protein